MKPGPDYERLLAEAARGLRSWFLAGLLAMVIVGLTVSTVLEQTGKL